LLFVCVVFVVAWCLVAVADACACVGVVCCGLLFVVRTTTG